MVLSGTRVAVGLFSCWLVSAAVFAADIPKLVNPVPSGEIGHSGSVTQNGLVLDLHGLQLRRTQAPMPALKSLAEGGGLSLDLWATLFDLAPGQVLLDSRDAKGRGIAVLTTDRRTLGLFLNDGRQRVVGDCNPTRLRPGSLQHLVFTLDGASKTVRVTIDGQPGDGETRFDGPSQSQLGNVSGGTLRFASSLHGYLKSVRIYNRPLSGREVVDNDLADRRAEMKRELLSIPAEIAPIKAPFPMPQLQRPQFSDRTFDIRQFGAVAGGQTLNTKAITAAIEACAAAGGGRVLVPEGIWLAGAVHLKSNVDLHLAKGAVLRFSTNPQDYLPAVFSRWAGFECHNYSPLIYARDCTNIAITGEGRLDGQGEAWWSWVQEQNRMAEILLEMGREGTPVEKRMFGDPGRPMRPQFISPIGCKNVLIEGISLNAGPFWTIQCIYCENVIVRGIAIDNYGPNNDGVNLDSSRNCLIEYCEFETGDDCVALKSGANEDGWRVGQPTENVVIRHCLMKRGFGTAIGSEMSGDVRHVYQHDCHGLDTHRGLYIKSAPGRGGIVEDVWAENMGWDHLQTAPLLIYTFYTAWLPTKSGKLPLIRDIHFKNVTSSGGRDGITIHGPEEQPIRNVTLEKVSFAAETGIQATNVVGLKIVDCSIRPRKGPPVTLTNNRDALIEGVTGPKEAKTLLRLQGEATRGIRFLPSEASDATRVELAPEVDQRELTDRVEWTARRLGILEGFQAPECVVVDDASGTAYVSNIAAVHDPKSTEQYWAEDGTGFISRLKAGGEMDTVRWKESNAQLPLNSCKGMCILEGQLAINDITNLVRFPLIGEGPGLRTPLEGAKRLNDMATDGRAIYASDMAQGVIYRIHGERVTKFPAPDGVNGITFWQGTLFTVSRTLHDVYEVDPSGQAKPKPFGLAQHFTGLDGIEVLADGTFLVSDIAGNKVCAVSPDRKRVRTLLEVERPADIGVDRTRMLLYVPSLIGDRVVIYRLERR